MSDSWKTRWRRQLGNCKSVEERVEWLSRQFETLAEKLAWLGYDELTEVGDLVLSEAAQERLVKALRVMRGGLRWAHRAVSAGRPGTANAALFGLVSEISVIAKAVDDCGVSVTVLSPGEGSRSSWEAALQAFGKVESSVREVRKLIGERASAPREPVSEPVDSDRA